MRVLIVDDHPLFREVIGLHVDECYPGSSIREAGSVQEALGVLAEYADFDLILLDVSLPGLDGIAGLALIRAVAPAVPIAMLSGIGDAGMAHAALVQGANGYITKAAGGRELKNALRLILRGETYISPVVLAGQAAEVVVTVVPLPVQDEPEPVGEFGMTPRQLEVCRLLMAGLPNKSIARKLDCAEGTIRLHVSAVLRALNVRNRTEVVQVALRLGIGKI